MADPSRNSPEPLTVEASPPGLEGWRRTFTALRNPNYRFFYIGQGLSLIGTWARSSALFWLAFAWTGSEFMTGMVAFTNSLPTLLFSILAGSMADRRSKLGIFRATSWFSLLSSTAMAAFIFSGNHHTALLLVFGLLWGTATAFEMPSRQSLIVDLVGRRDLSNAIALNSAMVNLSRVVGPALGGWLIAAFGPAWCFVLDALSFVAVLVGIRHIQLPPSTAPPGEGGALDHMGEAYAFVRRSPDLARTLGMLLVMSLGGWSYQSQLSPFVSKTLHMGAYGYGCMLAFAALGACLAALGVAYLNERLTTQAPAYAGVVVFSISIILCGFQTEPVAAAFFLFCSGFGLILFFSTSNTYLQSHVPDALRGRIMGLWALVFGGGMPIGALWMGIMAGKFGSARTLQMGGLFCLVAGSAVYFACSRKQVPVEPAPPESIP